VQAGKVDRFSIRAGKAGVTSPADPLTNERSNALEKTAEPEAAREAVGALKKAEESTSFSMSAKSEAAQKWRCCGARCEKTNGKKDMANRKASGLQREKL